MIAYMVAPTALVCPPEVVHWMVSPARTRTAEAGITEHGAPSYVFVDENVPKVDVTTWVKLEAVELAGDEMATASVMAEVTSELGTNPTSSRRPRLGIIAFMRLPAGVPATGLNE